MSTNVVIATRSGVVSAPDGTKHRLIRGKTLADARHPVAVAFPELFAPHTIDLPHKGNELERGEESSKLLGELVDARAAANDYREQLTAIVTALANHDGLPGEKEMTEHGWLARAVAEALEQRQAGADPVAPPPAPARRGPGRPRKQE